MLGSEFLTFSKDTPCARKSWRLGTKAVLRVENHIFCSSKLFFYAALEYQSFARLSIGCWQTFAVTCT